MIDPTYTYCSDHNGKVVVLNTWKGESYCVFPNGKKCDIGEYYSQLCDYKFNPKVVFNIILNNVSIGKDKLLGKIASNYETSLYILLLIVLGSLFGAFLVRYKNK